MGGMAMAMEMSEMVMLKVMKTITINDEECSMTRHADDW